MATFTKLQIVSLAAHLKKKVSWASGADTGKAWSEEAREGLAAGIASVADALAQDDARFDRIWFASCCGGAICKLNRTGQLIISIPDTTKED